MTSGPLRAPLLIVSYLNICHKQSPRGKKARVPASGNPKLQLCLRHLTAGATWVCRPSRRSAPAQISEAGLAAAWGFWSDLLESRCDIQISASNHLNNRKIESTLLNDGHVEAQPSHQFLSRNHGRDTLLMGFPTQTDKARWG